MSKSRLLAALQCDRRLWLSVHARDGAAYKPAQRLALQQGERVGELARQLAAQAYGTGELIDIRGPGGWEEGLTRCQARLAEPGLKVLFEAPFVCDGLGVVCDIVVRHADGRIWLIEVKSATGIDGKPYVQDAAVQAWAMARSGHAPERVLVRVIDGRFVYRGDGDYRGLFRDEDLTAAVAEQMPRVPELLERSRALAAGEEPEVRPGEQCQRPYQCGFARHCAAWEAQKFGPPALYPVQLLRSRNAGRLSREEWAEVEREGWRDLREVPAGFPASERAQRIIEAARTGEPWVSRELRGVLHELPYPRHYLDFETIGLAVPAWSGTRPYQPVPFQWSCHIERADGKVEHREFLDTSGADPRRACAESLLEAIDRDSGCVIVYNQAFEATRLRELAAQLPQHGESLVRIRDRVRDLLPIVRNHYYHPSQGVSYSIKAVLPAVVPELDYADLGDVQEGSEAQLGWLEIVDPRTDPGRRADLERALRRYCQLDTEGMLRLTRALSSEARSEP